MLVLLAGLAIAPTLGADDQPPINEILDKQLDQESEPSFVSVGIEAIWMAPTDATEFGYGLAAPVQMTALAPVIFEGRFQVHWSDLKVIFPDQNLYAFTFELGVQYRDQIGNVAPYVGVGVSYTKQSWPTDGGSELPPFDPYEPRVSSEIDLGDDFYPTFRMGAVRELSQKLSVILDLRYGFFKPRIPLTYIAFPSGNQIQLDQEVEADGLTIGLGIQVQIFRKK